MKITQEVLAQNLPFWGQLNHTEQELLQQQVKYRSFSGGEILYHGSMECLGLLLILSGQLRAYTVSDEGRELTLYRLREREMCLLSGACVIASLHFEALMQAERDTTVLLIPPEVYRELMQSSLAVARYTNELMAERFSDVMWLMDQIQNKKLDSRLAALLVEESELEGSDELPLTHEQLAHHLGSAREVVTRMLKYLQEDGLVQLRRGSIQLLDSKGLRELAQDSLRERKKG